MGLFQRISDGSELAHKMSSRLGVDFTPELLAAPDRAANTYRGILRRCMSCKHKAECSELLSADTDLDQAPAFCPNRGTFNARL